MHSIFYITVQKSVVGQLFWKKSLMLTKAALLNILQFKITFF